MQGDKSMEVKYYVCKHCGNIIEKVKDKGVKSGVWCYRYSCALVYLRRFEEALEYSRLGTEVESDYPWGWLQLGRLCYKFILLDVAFNS